MARGDVRHEDVVAAIAEYDQLGQQTFLDKYRMGKATAYLLRYDGKEYDSKAIFAAAHGHHPGLEPLAAEQFHGGENDAAKYLRRLGFEVYSSRGPTWERDEIILACDLVYRNGWKGLDARDERVVELSDLLQRLPIHPVEVRGPKFRNTNGVARKTYDLATHHPDYAGTPTKGGAGDLVVLQEFLDSGARMSAAAAAIRSGVESGLLVDEFDAVPDVDDLDGEAIEGRLLERRHFSRERDRSLRQKKIAAHLSMNATLTCFTCGFDFHAAYGEHGDGYIECHHAVPLHVSGETRTRLNDLVLICANCHRMTHRRSPWLSPDELLELISTQYDAQVRRSGESDVALSWRRSDPPHPEVYDIAFEADYNGFMFRAVRSRTGGSWRLERDDRSTGEPERGISHEDSLMACKKQVERGVIQNDWFAQ
ncbi:HNH endonuclease [Mycolicibacterium fluoranthenivorans]|uniref:HNH endonuclease n=1 Tax=Mycolicibacterium fluoranthenivorans TaxID=258505 RepID=A0A7G8PA39_9MYCO|nr:HNH endonuclease [Mycolicibacterium fluoranthenivorans]QNJ91205.1 HNH endonuclease [Mycolicibacterium fluoranthenivorans]